MHFGENQLSRSLIGLSPLPTAHPLSCQPKWVRSSTPAYRRFNLAMARSLRFGSRPSDYERPIRTRCRYGYPVRDNLATQHQFAGSFFKRHAVTPQGGSDGLYAHGFRIYFTPLPGYFSPFPPGTCPLSVPREYLGLAGGPARFVRDFSGPVLLGNTHRESSSFRLRGSHPLCRALPSPSPTTRISYSRPTR